MVEAAAPRAVRDESRLPAEPVVLSAAPSVPAASSVPAVSRALLALWVLIVVAVAAYLVAGTARVGAGSWIGRRMPVRLIWADFVGWLAEQGASPLLVAGITVAAAISLALAAGLLWLAFTLRDAPTPAAPDDASGSQGESGFGEG